MMEVKWLYSAVSEGWEMHPDDYANSAGMGPCGVYHPRLPGAWENLPGWAVWRNGAIVSETYATPKEAKAVAVALYRLGELT